MSWPAQCISFKANDWFRSLKLFTPHLLLKLQAWDTPSRKDHREWTSRRRKRLLGVPRPQCNPPSFLFSATSLLRSHTLHWKLNCHVWYSIQIHYYFKSYFITVLSSLTFPYLDFFIICTFEYIGLRTLENTSASRWKLSLPLGENSAP